MLSTEVFHEFLRKAHGGWTIRPNAFDGAGAHLLETNDQNAVDCIISDQGPGEMKAGGASSTCVVGVVDGD